MHDLHIHINLEAEHDDKFLLPLVRARRQLLQPEGIVIDILREVIKVKEQVLQLNLSLRHSKRFLLLHGRADSNEVHATFTNDRLVVILAGVEPDLVMEEQEVLTLKVGLNIVLRLAIVSAVAPLQDYLEPFCIL